MLGFTRQEQGIILFLILSLLIGLGVKSYRHFFADVSIVKVDQEYVEKFKKRAEVINSEAVDTNPVNSRKEEKNAFASSLKSKSLHRDDKPIAQIYSEEESPVLININAAGADELQRIPHIGSVLAERIIEYREMHKRFESIEELTEIKGIGETTLKKIAPYISLK